MVKTVLRLAGGALHLDRHVWVAFVQEAALRTCRVLARLLPCESGVPLEERAIGPFRVNGGNI